MKKEKQKMLKMDKSSAAYQEALKAVREAMPAPTIYADEVQGEPEKNFDAFRGRDVTDEENR